MEADQEIQIWTNYIHSIGGGLVETYDLCVFLDSHDNIIYVAYNSGKEIYAENEYTGSNTMISITAVDNPNDQSEIIIGITQEEYFIGLAEMFITGK